MSGQAGHIYSREVSWYNLWESSIIHIQIHKKSIMQKMYLISTNRKSSQLPILRMFSNFWNLKYVAFKRYGKESSLKSFVSIQTQESLF